MRTEAAIVKQLARSFTIWQGEVMKKTGILSKEDRLAEALRANLRRRKQAARGDEAVAPDDTRLNEKGSAA